MGNLRLMCLESVSNELCYENILYALWESELRPTNKNIIFILFWRTDPTERRRSRISIYGIIKDSANLMSFNGYDNKRE